MKNESVETKYTCDCWYAVPCWHLGKEDTSNEFGRKHKYFRHYCDSHGIYNNQLCIHCYKDGKRLVPRNKKATRHSVVQVYRNVN
jgi:hypothetical protein